MLQYTDYLVTGSVNDQYDIDGKIIGYIERGGWFKTKYAIIEMKDGGILEKPASLVNYKCVEVG